jgi:hypothetical protein
MGNAVKIAGVFSSVFMVGALTIALLERDAWGVLASGGGLVIALLVIFEEWV